MIKQTAIATLENSASKWLKEIIEDCDRVDNITKCDIINKEVVRISPEPTRKNNFLWNFEHHAWMGICQYKQGDRYFFTIKSEDKENWIIKLEKLD